MLEVLGLYTIKLGILGVSLFIGPLELFGIQKLAGHLTINILAI